MKEIKEQLYGFCQRWVDDRIAMAQGNIQAAQAAAILAEAGKQKQLLGKISTGEIGRAHV